MGDFLFPRHNAVFRFDERFNYCSFFFVFVVRVNEGEKKKGGLRIILALLLLIRPS